MLYHTFLVALLSLLQWNRTVLNTAAENLFAHMSDMKTQATPEYNKATLHQLPGESQASQAEDKQQVDQLLPETKPTRETAKQTPSTGNQTAEDDQADPGHETTSELYSSEAEPNQASQSDLSNEEYSVLNTSETETNQASEQAPDTKQEEKQAEPGGESSSTDKQVESEQEPMEVTDEDYEAYLEIFRLLLLAGANPNTFWVSWFNNT